MKCARGTRAIVMRQLLTICWKSSREPGERRNVHRRLAEIVDYVELSRADLLKTANGVHPSYAGIRPRASAWCVAEILVHVAMVEGWVAKLVSRSVTLGKGQGVGAETSEESMLSSLDRFLVTDPRVPVMASERGVPPRDSTMGTALESLGASRRALREGIREADGMDLAALSRRHPILGDLNMYQWVLFVGQHDKRHAQQVERVLRDLTEGAAESAPIL